MLSLLTSFRACESLDAQRRAFLGQRATLQECEVGRDRAEFHDFGAVQAPRRAQSPVTTKERADVGEKRDNAK